MLIGQTLAHLFRDSTAIEAMFMSMTALCLSAVVMLAVILNAIGLFDAVQEDARQ